MKSSRNRIILAIVSNNYFIQNLRVFHMQPRVNFINVLHESYEARKEVPY